MSPAARLSASVVMFFFNDTATTEIYTLSLHDALPICPVQDDAEQVVLAPGDRLVDVLGLPAVAVRRHDHLDRKSTRLNSSHANISYAVFCLKKTKRIFCHPNTPCTMSPQSHWYAPVLT